MGASRLWWKRFVEKVSFEPGQSALVAMTILSDLERLDTRGQNFLSKRLKLNADKTEFIWLGTRQQLSKVVATPLQVKDCSCYSRQIQLCDLSVLIDSQLTMEAHVRNVVRSCFYQLRQLRSIRRSLPTDARRTLAAAFIASGIDYCSGVVYGVSSQVRWF